MIAIESAHERTQYLELVPVHDTFRDGVSTRDQLRIPRSSPFTQGNHLPKNRNIESSALSTRSSIIYVFLTLLAIFDEPYRSAILRAFCS
jgi:hypothetical protein